MLTKEQGIVSFLIAPILFFVAYIVMVFISHKRERESFSFLKNTLFESFTNINPTLLYISRILFILYIVSTIPFYAYLTFFASKYGSMYMSLTVLILLISLVLALTTFATSFIKLSAPRWHIFSFLGMAMSSIVLSLLMAQFFNVTREIHIFSVNLDITLFVITIISIAPALAGGIVLANKRLLKWEFYDKEKDKIYYLAFAEWSTVFLSILSFTISVLGFFLVQ